MSKSNNNAARIPSGAVLLATITLGCGTTTTLIGGDTLGAGGAGGAGSSDCPGQCLPLGPSDWLGPTLLWSGAEEALPDCPESAPVPSALVFAGLNAPNVCGLCKCDAPTGSCALPSTLTAYNSTACPAPAGAAPTPFDAPAAWDGSCTAANPIPQNQQCNGTDCVQSLIIAPLTLTEEPCGVHLDPVAAQLPNTWATVARTCHGAAFGPCATPAEICAPSAPEGFEQCLFREDDSDCPANYPVRHMFNRGFDDSRDCSPCACGAPTGSTCMSQVSVFSDGNCSVWRSMNGVDAAGPTCFDIAPSGQALGSKSASAPIYAPGVCQATGGQPLGNAIPSKPTTFCCLPPPGI